MIGSCSSNSNTSLTVECRHSRVDQVELNRVSGRLIGNRANSGSVGRQRNSSNGWGTNTRFDPELVDECLSPERSRNSVQAKVTRGEGLNICCSTQTTKGDFSSLELNQTTRINNRRGQSQGDSATSSASKARRERATSNEAGDELERERTTSNGALNLSILQRAGTSWGRAAARGAHRG